MESTLNFNLPLSYKQVAEMVKQLPKPQKIQLVKLLQKEVKHNISDMVKTHLASQSILASDWNNEDEEKAWQHL